MISHKHTLAKAVAFFLFSCLFAYFATMYSHLFFASLSYWPGEVVHSSEFLLDRFLIFLVFFCFVSLHFLMPYRTLYAFLFKYRYAIAGVVFFLLVFFEFHGSSFSVVSKMIQPAFSEGAYQHPVLGLARRTYGDEFNVFTPLSLSQWFNHYGVTNAISTAYPTNMLTTYNQPAWDLVTLAKPFYWGYLIFGSGKGLSWYWVSRLMCLFFASFECFRVLTKDNRWLSLSGALLITFAPIIQNRFSVNFLIEMIFAGEMIIILTYYYLREHRKYNKVLFSILISLCACLYVFSLYPPYMIAFAYLFGALFIGILVQQYKYMKRTRFDLLCILIFLASFSIIIGHWLFVSKDAILATLHSVYPGNRSFPKDGDGLYDLVSYATNLLTYNKTPVSVASASAMGFFPMTELIAIVYVVKKKFKDIIANLLLSVVLFFEAVLLLGIPEILNTISFMSYIYNMRLAPVAMFVDIFLFIYVLASIDEPLFLSKLNQNVFLIFSICVCALFMQHLSFIDPLFIPTFGINRFYLVFFVCLLFLFSLAFLKKLSPRSTAAFSLVCAVIALISGGLMNPIMRTTDALYEKPFAQKIQAVQSATPGNWMANSSIISNYLIENGAPTVSSIHIIPTVEKWKKLDPSGQYEFFYNRYAHIEVILTDDDTSFSLVHSDGFTLHLSLNDMHLLDVTYYVTDSPDTIPSVDWNGFFELLYQEDNIWLYKVSYI